MLQTSIALASRLLACVSAALCKKISAATSSRASSLVFPGQNPRGQSADRRPFSAAPPPLRRRRRRDGQVEEPHVAQPVRQGAQERCAKQPQLFTLLLCCSPASAACLRWPPALLLAADADFYRCAGIKKPKRNRYSSTKGVRAWRLFAGRRRPAALQPPPGDRAPQLLATRRLRNLHSPALLAAAVSTR